MSSIQRELTDETATIALGQELALFSRNAVTICLHGDLGAGKTTLARALIKTLASSKNIPDVPSPTFSLVQPYDDLRIPVHHYDLYRIENLDEAYELGLFDDLENRLTIIEWPERLGAELPINRIDVFFEIKDEYRSVKITGNGLAANIVSRIEMVSNFLANGTWRSAQRRFLQGDASARRYERLTLANGDKAILVDMPSSPCGPIIKDGKTYSEIAHTAEGIVPVAGINSKLLDLGFSAPVSLQQDLKNGLMIIEDFGDKVFGVMINGGQNMEQPIKAATQLLADMAIIDWPNEVDKHKIPDFDFSAFRVETELLLDWFWPLQNPDAVGKETSSLFLNTWKHLFSLVKTDHPVWVLRDFHSPNLIWMPTRKGTQRVGLIDTQDCLLGHPAYDLVSMLQDARADLPDGFEAKYLSYYCQLRQQQEPHFDVAAFETAYAVFGAQRATKILGIFARLYKRDGKPGYLQHIPRVSAALEKNLKHPALSDLAHWYSNNLPSKIRIVMEEL